VSSSQSRIDSRVGGWQLEVSPALELTAEESTGLSQRSEYEVDVRWSPPYEDVSPEAQERPSLEAVTKQRD
jgi:hypothetical protein